MYFNKGNLPWQGMKAKNRKEKYQKIMEKKISTTPEILCKNYPGKNITILMFNFCRGVCPIFSKL